MKFNNYHLAQFSIAIAKAPLDDPMMQGFVKALPTINALSEQAPGFVWRLQTEQGDATGIRGYDDPLKLLNMSLWESLEALKNFVYKSHHGNFYRNRQKWFTPVKGPNTALWWVPCGQIPSVCEGVERLAYLEQHGPSPYAFSFATPFFPASNATYQDVPSKSGKVE